MTNMLLQRVREGGFYGMSFMLTAVVIGNAFQQKKQFYPAVVYLTKSNPSLAVLAAQALVFVVLLGKLTRKIFFGSLRAAEVEHLIERSWYAVTETCLAFTVFREDFNVMFVAMFTMLLFFKCFHWLAEDRVDYMERSPMLGWVFHTRALGLLTMLGAVDCYFMKHAYIITLVKGASAQLVFGFEYAILMMIVFTVLVKYSLHCIDLYDENPWENKAVYLLYLELLTNGVKFILYVLFVAIMSKVHTFPLFAIRPLYLTMRSFKKALADVILSRRAIRNMNQLYPDATEEDLQSVDVCIICREPMVAEGGCKKLPCTHIFHASCLRSWFQRQQTCPTCRMEVLNLPATRQAGRPAAPGAPAAPAAPANAPRPAPAQQAAQANLHHAAYFRMHMPQPAVGAQAQAQPVAATPQTDAQANNTQAPNQNAAQPQMVPPFPFMGFPGGFPPMPPNMPNLPAGAVPGAQAMPPFMPPPSFMPFGPMPPPFMPTSDISQLSEEELTNMESNERDAIQTRIQWLRDIQTLIDSAVQQMNQYTQVMTALNASRPPLRTTNQMPSPESANQAPAAAAAPKNNTTAPVPQTIRYEGASLAGAGSPAGASLSGSSGGAAVGGARPKTSLPPSTSVVVSSSTGPTEESSSSLTASTPSSPSPVAPSSPSSASSEQEEVRRRRLARFSSQDTNSDNNTSSTQQS